VDYVVTATGFTPGANPATVTWTRNDGSGIAASVLANQPMSGRLLWPGTTLGPGGTAVDWPGWRFENGSWIQEDDGLRPTMQLTVAVNPTASQIVNYPPATPACNANPTITGGPVNQTQVIPATSRWSQLLMALGMLLIGAVVMRRRTAG
jgi:hypothetical protein